MRATQPLEQLLPKGATSQQLTTFAQQFEQAASETGFKHMALGTLGASIKPQLTKPNYQNLPLNTEHLQKPIG
ncbi:MAG: hypothetical protein ACPHHR_03485 [Cycloclasticus sp.]